MNQKTLREDAHDTQVEIVASRLRVSARVRKANSFFIVLVSMRTGNLCIYLDTVSKVFGGIRCETG